MEDNNSQPDSRSLIYYYLYNGAAEDPSKAHEEILKALDGFMDKDALLAAFNVFKNIGNPIPKIPIISAILLDNGDNFSPDETKAVLYVLIMTGSWQNYREEIDFICKQSPEISRYVSSLT